MLKKMLMVGMLVVLLGGLLTAVGQAAGPPEQEDGREYVIQSDDWLSKLAEKYLGDGNLWPRIVEATNSRAATDRRLAIIKNPNVIHAGQIIFIPTTSAALPRVVQPQPVEPPAVAPPAVQPQVVQPAVGGSNLAILCQDQHPAVQAFCSEIPIARIHFDPYEEAEYFTCASRAGLVNARLDPYGVTILVPNDGDFDLDGIVAAVKVTPGGSWLIPRWPGSWFDFSEEYAREFKLPMGEQRQISLTKAFELIKAGELIWTGKHGEPGKAGLFQTNPPLRCDPQADFEIVIGPF
jgi:hypothetical protein